MINERRCLSPAVVMVAIVLAMCGTVVSGQGTIGYKLRVDLADLSSYDIEIHVPGAGGTVRLAMSAHPEYDDRYFRYVENFSAESGGRKLVVTRPEEAVWQVDEVHGGLTVRYRVKPPSKEREWRQTWKPFLTPTGGRVGDLHMLMYVVGREKHPARFSVDIPASWKAVSGLERTNDPRTFVGTVEELLDSPVLIGDVREWRFTADGVPHTVAIWSHADAQPVGAAPLVDGVQKIAEQAIKAFGKPPYPRYAFLIENGGQAALEHRTSLNAALSSDIVGFFERIGHEYIHAWNLMDVRPRERVGLNYKFAGPTGILWWSEGATLFLSDLLLRRAGVPVEHRTRTQQLESIMTRFLSAPGYSTLPAELVSRGDSHPELLPGDWAGTHLQGEVLVTLLDLKIRDARDGRRSVDDVMRLLSDRFDIHRGVGNPEIQRAISDVCSCDVKGFFNGHIYAAKPIDFDNYLRMIGMRAEIKKIQAVDPQGGPLVDLRIGPASGEGEFRLRVANSESAWARAGIRTGDKLISADGEPVADWNEFRTWLRTLKVGDKARLALLRGGVEKIIEVPLKPFDVPSVRLVELENANAKQIRLREAWRSSF